MLYLEYMLFSQKKYYKTVIYLDDKNIRYLTLCKKGHNFVVSAYDSAPLDQGVIHEGELLRVDFLKKVLQKIAKKLPHNKVELLLPHHLFQFEQHFLDIQDKKLSKRKFLTYLKRNKSLFNWSGTHAYEYELSFGPEKKTTASFFLLAQNLFFSYDHVFRSAGLSLGSVRSYDEACFPFIEQKGSSLSISIGKKETRISHLLDGRYQSCTSFSFSYQGGVNKIKNILSVNSNQAEKIFNEYGVMQSHRDKKVFTELMQATEEIKKYLHKIQFNARKNEDQFSIFVHYDFLPIKGFVHLCSQYLGIPIQELSLLDNRKLFPETPLLHKKESYPYHALIARAVYLFDK